MSSAPRRHTTLAAALLLAAVLGACNRGGLGGQGVHGTYLQEGVRSSPLQTRITLNEGNTFVMEGANQVRGTFHLSGSTLTLTAPAIAANSVGGPVDNVVVTCTLSGGTITVPAGQAFGDLQMPAARFKKH